MAMLIAVETDDSVRLESLLRRGADPNAADNTILTALDFAKQRKKGEIVPMIEQAVRSRKRR